MSRTVIRHSMAQMFKLGALVTAEYTKSNMNDNTFAALATERLGFTVTCHHIEGSREALGVANNLRKPPETIIERLEAMEKAIGNLIRRVDTIEAFRKSLEG